MEEIKQEALEEVVEIEEVKEKEPLYNKIEEYVMAVCFAVMCVVTFINVVTRYCFSFTFSWAEQLTRILFVWLTFSGISYAGLKSAHLKVTAVQLILPKKIGLILLLIGDVVSAAFGFVSSVYIFNIVRTIVSNGQTFPSMPWLPAWVMYIPGVIFMFTFGLRVIQAGIIPNLREMANKEA